ncbi:MAG: tRNA wybutosine-synthesizing 3 family protein [Candidatus Pacearchaeota archaeon]
MPFDRFNRRKKTVLSKQDKSSKGNCDEKVVSLCEKINSLDNYYTTSSCSGRIVLMIDQDKKAEGLFKFVSHDLITFEELKNELEKIFLSNSSPPAQRERNKRNEDILEKSNPLNIKFKQEPCVLHVACKNLEDAFHILNKAKKVGWKRSGIISEGNGFVVELLSTEKLEFPIIHEEELIVDDKFLKIVVNKANENLKKSWGKIKELEKEIK